MDNKASQFLAEDFEVLLQRIAELELAVMQSGQAIGETTEQSSETWHDNAPYDIARQNFENLANELELLTIMRNQAVIIDQPTTTEEIQIGHTVIIEDTSGQKQKLKIAGKMVK